MPMRAGWCVSGRRNNFELRIMNYKLRMKGKRQKQNLIFDIKYLILNIKAKATAKAIPET